MGHRFLSLDGMRGVAAIAVMLFHFSQHGSVSFLRGASLAVDLFFCLSGFVISHSYAQRVGGAMSSREFMRRRLIRLYPLFFMGFALGCLALFLKIQAEQSNITWPQFQTIAVLNGLFLPFLGDFQIQIGAEAVKSAIFPINDPAWSLFFEWIAYWVWCVIPLRKRSWAVWLVAAAGFVGVVTWTLLQQETIPGWGAMNFWGGFPRVLAGFFSGCVVYQVHQRFGDRIPKIGSDVLLVLVTLLLFKSSTTYYWLVCVALVVPAMVLLGASNEAGGTRRRALYDYLGWLSYPLYCLHFPVLLLFSRFHPESLSPSWMALCAIVSVIVAHLVARYVDEPVRGLLDGKSLGAQARSSL